MKYIRTKFKVITKEEFDKHNILCKDDSFKWRIVEQANTIEELCDEFVLLNPCEDNYPMLLTGLFPDIKHNLFHISYAGKDTLNYEDFCFPDELPLNEAKVFGAIWVKGEHGEPTLKPVAKLNNEGELELL